jgi:methionyl aminopeptidase
VPVGRVRPRERRLAAAAQSALRLGLEAATAGPNVGAIGAAVQAEVERRGFSVCAELTGHGIGRRIHEEPDVPNVAWDGPPLTPGLVITVEPIIAAGAGDVYIDDDGWTVRTEDGSPSAHAEHTIVVTEGAPILVTA